MFVLYTQAAVSTGRVRLGAKMEGGTSHDLSEDMCEMYPACRKAAH